MQDNIKEERTRIIRAINEILEKELGGTPQNTDEPPAFNERQFGILQVLMKLIKIVGE